jgi:hypothetical protein
LCGGRDAGVTRVASPALTAARGEPTLRGVAAPGNDRAPDRNSPMLPRALLAAVLTTPVLAQSTWVVNAAGGPGVHFTTVPAALASPGVVDGDTVLVHAGPFLEGCDPFTTSKGVTIVGVGGAVPIYTSSVAGIEVVGLPAGRSFRLVGFSKWTDGELRLRAASCAGTVHFENLHAREPDLFFPTQPAITIDACASVTLRDVENFGTPAVSVLLSRAAIVSCRLGITSLGLGGGAAVQASNAFVDVVQPRFEPVFGSAILASNTDLRITGDGGALLAGGTSPSSVPAILANGGSVVLDPAVPTPTGTAPVLAGNAAFTVAPVAGSWTLAAATPGQTLSIRTRAATGAVVFQALGAPGPLSPTALGVLGIDAAVAFVFFPAAIAPARGVVTSQVLVPAALPVGQAFASQAVVWNGSTLGFGAPVTFTVH